MATDTASQALAPNFLVIGAQKSGTTWLYEMLSMHPEIFLPETKELDFFSYTHKSTPEGYVEYLKNFAGSENYDVRGEVTPGYFWNAHNDTHWCCAGRTKLFHDDIPGNVKTHLGENIQLILILRNPVERAVSAYFHHFRLKRFGLGESILEVGRKFGIVHMGFYFAHLKMWLEHYPIEQFKILTFEEAMQNKAGALKDIFQFLDVEQNFLPEGVEAVVHRGHKRKKEGQDVFIDHPEQGRVKMISAEEISELQKVYAKDVEQLGTFLGKDLSQVWF